MSLVVADVAGQPNPVVTTNLVDGGHHVGPGVALTDDHQLQVADALSGASSRESTWESA